MRATDFRFAYSARHENRDAFDEAIESKLEALFARERDVRFPRFGEFGILLTRACSEGPPWRALTSSARRFASLEDLPYHRDCADDDEHDDHNEKPTRESSTS